MHFDRIVLAAVLALALVIGGLSVAAARLGPSVDSLTTAQALDGTSVNTQVGLTFTEPMNTASVNRNFHIDPRVPGDYTWSGNSVFFTPRHSLAYGMHYTLTVGTGARDVSGRHLAHVYEATITTQSEHLLYLATQGSNSGRLVLTSITGRETPVGSADGLVTDFSVSFDGSLAVYVKRGSHGERPDEIWMLSLADDSTQRIFRKTDWALTQPHFSPDGSTIVFLATNVRICSKYYGCYRDRSGPVVEMLNVRTGKVRAFRSRTDVPLTNFIAFSPSGQIAYTDLGSALTLAQPSGGSILHIPDRGNSLEFAGFDSRGDKAAFVGQTPSSSGGDVLVYQGGSYVDVSRGVYDSSTPGFSTSGKQIAYAAYRGELGIQPIYGINVYNFSNHRTLHLTAEHTWSDWTPTWSQDDRYIAFVRSQPQEAMYMGSGAIWVMRSDGRDARPLGGEGMNPQWVT